MPYRCPLTTESPLPPWPVGEALYRRAKEVNPAGRRILFAFSRGKDAIASWIALRDHFDIHPFFRYQVPGLEFVEESLAYFERFFGTRIKRYPHRALTDWLKDQVYQPLDRALVLQDLQFPRWTHDDSTQWAREDFGLPPKTIVGTGVRSFDNIVRRTALKKHGPLPAGPRTFHAIWDWKKAHLMEVLRGSGVKLPIDYRLFGRSFDGLNATYLIPIKKHFPRDFRRIVEWFPMVEAEVMRAERSGKFG